MFRERKQHATGPQQENKRHGHDLQVKHNKTCTLSYLQTSLEHAQTHMERLQIITVSDLSGNNIRLQCLELSNNMLQELNMATKGMA